MAVLPGFQWVDNPRSDGGTYATDGPSCILLHMTVSMGISAGYIASHPYPPQFWANPYTGERWQTISPDRSAFALYQANEGISWTNKKGYTLQTELVGVPVVNEATYTDKQCQWIGEQVVAPQAAWLASIGRPVDLNQVRYHTDSSGSASEYWSGRMGDGAEWDSFNGLCAHIDCPQNDHWDCSVEKLDLIAAYARAATGEEEFLSAEQYDDIMGKLNWLQGQLSASDLGSLSLVRQIYNDAEVASKLTQWLKDHLLASDLGSLVLLRQIFNDTEALVHGQSGPGVDKATVLREASVDELLAALKDKTAQIAHTGGDN